MPVLMTQTYIQACFTNLMMSQQNKQGDSVQHAVTQPPELKHCVHTGLIIPTLMIHAAWFRFVRMNCKKQTEVKSFSDIR